MRGTVAIRNCSVEYSHSIALSKMTTKYNKTSVSMDGLCNDSRQTVIFLLSKLNRPSVWTPAPAE